MYNIPFIQQLRNIEADEDVKNYMFDTITQIEKANPWPLYVILDLAEVQQQL